MNSLSLQNIAEYAGGYLTSGSSSRCVNGVTIDSRKVSPGNLFIAVKGERFDGHNFIDEAVQKGAIAVMVQRGAENLDSSIGVIRVKDTVQGLQQLASSYRRSLSARTIGVTGSSGKSSTKEMLASVLEQRFPIHKNPGSYNNHIGVPLTLLDITEKNSWVVVEIGMNHPGEIAALTKLVQPEVAVVTNIGWVHVEAFQDQNDIAQEKSELVKALPEGGWMVLNADDERVRDMQKLSPARSVLAGESEDAAYRFENISVFDATVKFDLITPKGKAPVVLHTPAPHMAQNAVLAAAVGGELGLDPEEIAAGLSQVQFPSGRCTIAAFREGWLIDDTYNANPDSMLGGFDATLALSGRPVALLGAMGELGRYTRELHEMVGRSAVERGVRVLFALGEDCKFMVEAARKQGMSETWCRWFADHESLAKAYQEIAEPQDCILVKGSRSQQMEKVVHYIKQGGVSCSTT